MGRERASGLPAVQRAGPLDGAHGAAQSCPRGARRPAAPTWTVLPRPISSARMPLRLWSASPTIQRSPCQAGGGVDTRTLAAAASNTGRGPWRATSLVSSPPAAGLFEYQQQCQQHPAPTCIW
jgi:hypothetical protein